MTARIDQVVRGVAAYYDKEICEKAVGPGQFMACFAKPAIPKLVESKLRSLLASPIGAELTADDGSVDLEVVKEWARSAMDYVGSVDLAGFRFAAADVDSIYDYIRRA